MAFEGMDYKVPLKELINRPKEPKGKEGTLDLDSANKDFIAGNKFDERKAAAKDLIKKIDFDANPGKKTDKELNLEKEVERHVEGQFNALERNYALAVNKLGGDREKKKGGIVEAEDILSGSVDRFIVSMERDIFKENVRQGSVEARGVIIEEFLEKKGIQVKGMGKYLAEASRDTLQVGNAGSKEELYKMFEQILDNKVVLQSAITKMVEELPKTDNQNKKGEREKYFKDQFEASKPQGDNRLTGVMGDNNWGWAASVLAMRFDITFDTKDTKKPLFIVDTTTNKVYGADSQEWKEELKRICNEELNNSDKIQRQSEGLTKLKKEKDSQHDELVKGTWGLDWEVHKLGRLKDNPLLTDVLRTTIAYNEGMNRDITDTTDRLGNRSEKVKNPRTREALNGVISSLTPENVRNAGLIGSLAELIKMIEAVLCGKNPTEYLTQAQKDIEAKKNPMKEKKDTEEFFDNALNKADPGPTLDDLINPLRTNDYFKNKAIIMPEFGASKADELVSRYPKKRAEMVTKYLADKLGVDGISIKPTDNGYTLGVRQKDNTKTYEIEKKDEKYTIKLLPKGEPQDFEFTIDGLKQFLAPPTDKKAEKKEKAPEKSDEEYAEIVLNGMILDKPVKDTNLGKLITEFGLTGEININKLYKGKTIADKQQNLDTARKDLILQKLKDSKSGITIKKLQDSATTDFGKRFEDAKKQPQTAPAEAPVAPVVTPKVDVKDEANKSDIATLKESLQKMIPDLKVPYNPTIATALGIIIEKLNLIPTFRKEGDKDHQKKKGSERQVALDTARAKFISGKLDDGKISVDALKAALASISTQPPASADTQTSVQPEASASRDSTSVFTAEISTPAEKKVTPIAPKISDSDIVKEEKTAVLIDFMEYVKGSDKWKFSGEYSAELNTDANRQILARALKNASYKPDIPVSISSDRGSLGVNVSIFINGREFKGSGSNAKELFKKTVEKIANLTK
jgi:hypothetical protein